MIKTIPDNANPEKAVLYTPFTFLYSVLPWYSAIYFVTPPPIPSSTIFFKRFCNELSCEMIPIPEGFRYKAETFTLMI